MRKYFVWLTLEWKRVACRLPFVLSGAVLLTGIAVGMLLCGQIILEKQPEQNTAVVAVAAREDELTQLAISFVENMDSLKGWCRFEQTDPETGLRMLQSGEAAAMVELPDQVVEHILNGSNVPAALYLREDMGMAAMLFQEMTEAGVSMLGLAQGEIYAAHEFWVTCGMEGNLSELYAEIDRYNLNLALDREKLFRVRNLSGTGDSGLLHYYVGAGFSVILLCMGMVLEGSDREAFVRGKLLAGTGIGRGAQVLGKWCVLTVFLALAMLIPLIILFLSPFGGAIEINPGGLPGIFLTLMCAAAMHQTAGLFLHRPVSRIFLTAAGSLCMGFLCGCFVPEALLPEILRSLGKFLPMRGFRQAWSCFLGGAPGELGDMAVMAAFAAGALLLSVFWYERTGESR
ncbi:MAG: ABC transporter permease [Lachnospiraceae bacterium]|nr:ABC transporter permease [Lachnospiraceae bacterium]